MVVSLLNRQEILSLLAVLAGTFPAIPGAGALQVERTVNKSSGQNPTKKNPGACWDFLKKEFPAVDKRPALEVHNDNYLDLDGDGADISILRKNLAYFHLWELVTAEDQFWRASGCPRNRQRTKRVQEEALREAGTTWGVPMRVRIEQKTYHIHFSAKMNGYIAGVTGPQEKLQLNFADTDKMVEHFGGNKSPSEKTSLRKRFSFTYDKDSHTVDRFTIAKAFERNLDMQKWEGTYRFNDDEMQQWHYMALFAEMARFPPSRLPLLRLLCKNMSSSSSSKMSSEFGVGLENSAYFLMVQNWSGLTKAIGSAKESFHQYCKKNATNKNPFEQLSAADKKSLAPVIFAKWSIKIAKEAKEQEIPLESFMYIRSTGDCRVQWASEIPQEEWMMQAVLPARTR